MQGPLNRLSADMKKHVKKRTQPGFMKPMEATLVHRYFSDPDWIFERKLDGERCLVHKKSGIVTLYSRNQKQKNESYPEISDRVLDMPGNFILDGEIVAFESGRTSFSALQNRMHVHSPDHSLRARVPVYCYIFDILYFAEYDLTDLPLRERKNVLKAAFKMLDPIRFLPHRNADGEVYLKEACAKEWEGLIAKHAESQYVHSRSKNWLKFKCSHRQEFVIGGYTEPQGNRTGFGALLLGYHTDKGLRFAGRVGTGFDEKTLRNLHQKMQRRQHQSSPFNDYDEEEADVNWITPDLVGEVGFNEWTPDGKLRHPRFLGLRDDKDAAEVVREDA